MSKNARSGFTITELMIAAGLTSAFFLLGASVIQQLFQFQRDVDKRLMDNFSVVNFHRAMNADLAGSYWHRYGAFTCPTSNDVMNTLGSSTASIPASGGLFEFVTTDFSSTVGNVPGTELLSVATMRNLEVGDYVVLSSAADASHASLFKISSVDRKRSEIKLETGSLSLAGTSCGFALPAKTLVDFFGPMAPSNTLISRIKVVQYSIKDGEFIRTLLPGSAGGEKIMSSMNGVKINSTWKSSGEGSAQKQFGQMKFEVTLENNQSTLMGGKSTSKQKQTVVAQYGLESFQYLNKTFTSGSQPITAIFPTCSVGYNFRPGALKISPSADEYADTVPVAITGAVSTDKVKGSTIEILFSPGANAAIYCFKHDPDSGVYPTNGSAVSSKGIQGSISLLQGANFDVYTCAVKGQVEISASMTYFSADINAVKTIACSTETISAPLQYKFQVDNKRPECEAALAKTNMGSEIQSALADGTTVSLGQFGLDPESSCQWEGQPTGTSVIDGKADDCDWGSHPGKDLKRIYLRPYKQQVYGKDNKPIYSANGAYVDCD